MGVKIERGNIEELMPIDEKGEGGCRINDLHVKLPRDLADSINTGDDVVVAGILRDSVLHAMALKDLTQEKVRGVDCTYYILLTGTGWFLFIMFGVFALQGIAHGDSVYLEALNTVISFFGLLLALYFTRHTFQIMGAVKRVS